MSHYRMSPEPKFNSFLPGFKRLSAEADLFLDPSDVGDTTGCWPEVDGSLGRDGTLTALCRSMTSLNIFKVSYALFLIL